MSPNEMKQRGWDSLDVILISGDAYVDHPSYGTAVIGRVLEGAGLRVGVIAQPDWRKLEDFRRLGAPGLFFGITSGNLDSMVSNYTSHKKPRLRDAYSPGGAAGLRPDRATIVYANRVREAFGQVPVVLGGIEASLRRLAHYDWWENRVRRSILLDARADILVYGMGESQVLEIVRRMRNSEDLLGIPGTVVVRKGLPSPENCEKIPSFEEAEEDKDKFNAAFLTIARNQDPFSGKPLVQPHGDRYVIHFPPPVPASEQELDRIYALPYTRSPHPSYHARGGVPGFETVRFSIVSHRGCCGACSFCSLSMHQGRIVQSRSVQSIVREARLISNMSGFRGTITDVGGPTVNLYRAQCPRWTKNGGCANRDCLIPEPCRSLRLGYREAVGLYRTILGLPLVKHVFLESGLRYDLLVDGDDDGYLEQVCRHHVGGRMKVAPEHASDRVLRLMNKPGFGVYERFVKRFEGMRTRVGKDEYIVNYFISSHPGATLEDEKELVSHLRKRHMRPEQVQDFTPLPLTLSACMYYTGKHPVTGERLYVAKSFRERKARRALIQGAESLAAGAPRFPGRIEPTQGIDSRKRRPRKKEPLPAAQQRRGEDLSGAQRPRRKKPPR
jgi:uncharacterized radical SAM protein YgiQ